nr:hypothetical protein [uncultured Draconibacterium sp.]
MMRQKLFLLFLFIGQVSFSQGFKTLYIEKKNVDSDNKIFKIGRAFIYDYEIIENGYNYKLNYNAGLPENKFELVKDEKDTLELKIHLLIPKVEKKERTNKNQTETYYIFEPTFSFMSQTGIVENNSNVWIHPPRSGFFAALETCPYPYVKLPIKIGKEWNDKMKIGDQWCNKKWGVWNKKLLLAYDYKITQKTKVKTDLGELDCFVIESTAKSEIGQSKLTSYFSEKYGFVRLDYELATGIKVNLWIDNLKENNNFNGYENIGKYIDKQKKTVANKL